MSRNHHSKSGHPQKRKKSTSRHRQPGKAARAGKSDIERLTRELNRERRENAKLRRQLAEARKKMAEHPSSERLEPIFKHKQMTPRQAQEQMLSESSKRAGAFSRPNYLMYLVRLITTSSLYRIVNRLFLFFRRFRLANTITTIVLVVMTAAVSAVYLMALPAALLVSGLFVIFGLLAARQMNKKMKTALKGKHIRVVIPPDDLSLKDDSFLARSACAMAGQSNTAVILVSPHILSMRGLGGHGPYLTARQEGNDLYIVRCHYYFILRRRVLDVLDPHMTVIY